MRRACIILFPCLLLSIFACTGGKRHVTSKELDSPEARVEELKKYFRLRTELLDAEFDIFDVNLNPGLFELPGATSRLYKVALLVKKDDLKSWLDENCAITSFPIDEEWTEELVKDNNNFRLEEGPRFVYRSEHKDMIVYESEGVIFIRIRQD